MPNSSVRFGFIRRQKPLRCGGEAPAASTGAGTPAHSDEDVLAGAARRLQCVVDGGGRGCPTLVGGVVGEICVGVLEREDPAAQIGDGGQDVVRADVGADDDCRVGTQLEPAGGAALAVVADRARIGKLAKQTEGDELLDDVDRGRASQSDSGHRVARGEDIGVPRVGQHAIQARAAHGSRG